MANYSEPKPLAERASKHVTFGQFLKETWPVPAAWLGGLLAGMAAAKARGLDLEGSRAKLTMIIPAKVGAFAALFMMWRKKEAERLGVEEIYANYKDARGQRMTNDQLAQDNKLLQQQIEFEERKSTAAQSILAQGPKNHHDHAHRPEAEMAASR